MINNLFFIILIFLLINEKRSLWNSISKEMQTLSNLIHARGRLSTFF